MENSERKESPVQQCGLYKKDVEQMDFEVCKSMNKKTESSFLTRFLKRQKTK